MRSLAVLALMVACGGSSVPPPPLPGVIGTEVYLTLPLLDGEVQFPALRGKPVVAHFGTTWSLAAHADRQELQRAVAAGATVIEIMLDLDARLVRPWAAAAKPPWPVALATPDVVDGRTPFGKVAVVPTTFVLDRGGRIAWRRVGGLVPRELDAVIVEASRAPP